MRPRNVPILSGFVAAVVLPLLAASALAVDAYWAVDAGGNWNDAFNWTNSAAPPNGAGHIANLTAPLTGNRAIALASEVTLGQLVVENDEYDIGSATATTPDVVFDNGGAPASVRIINQNTALSKTTEFKHPLRVVDRLLFESIDSGNAGLNILSGFKGDSTAVLDFTYQLSSGQSMVEFRANQNYAGTVNLRRVGTVSQTLGIRFYNADAIFAGSPGSIRVHPGVTLNFRSALTDSQAARFAWVGNGQSVVLDSSGTFKDLTSPEAMVPHGGLLHWNHSSSTLLRRYPDGAAVPLDNTTLRLTGYNTAPGQTNEEFPGTLGLTCGGNRIWVENRTQADSIAGIHFGGFARDANATCTFRGSGRGAPLGSTASNRVTVASGLPGLTNGVLPPYLVYFDTQFGSTVINGMFMTDGPNGLTVFDAYQATNSFDLGASAVVHVTSAVNLGGAPASCYALRGRARVENGDLTIHSGGLILGNAFQNWTANLFFGESGAGTAYVHMDGHSDAAKSIELQGTIHCLDFVKFGAQTDLRLTASNSIAGKVELQEGGLVAANQFALGPDVDLEMGIGTRFDLKNSGGTCEIGGLRSRGTATVRPNGTASEHLVVSPAAGTTNVFNGALSNVGGTLSVTVAGAGRQVFNGASDYTGDTAVASGATLLLGDDGALGATTVAVAAGGTFGGTGSVSGTLSLADAAILKLTPGAPLRVGTLSAVAAGTVTVDVGEADPLVEGVALSWTGASPAESPTIALTGAPAMPNGTYRALYDGTAKTVEVVFVRDLPTVLLIR